MTKQEHDAATKYNFGGQMASDERRSYHYHRGLRIEARRDYIADRAAAMAWINRTRGRDPFCPTLGKGSKYRNVASYRAQKGITMLDSRT